MAQALDQVRLTVVPWDQPGLGRPAGQGKGTDRVYRESRLALQGEDVNVRRPSLATFSIGGEKGLLQDSGEYAFPASPCFTDAGLSV